MGRILFISLLSLGCESEPSPNLVVAGFGCSEDGGQLECEVLVENIGETEAGGFDVDLFVDPGAEPEAPQVGDASDRVADGLLEGDVTGLTLRVPACTSCELWVLVDAGDEVVEWDEADNTAGPQLAR